MSLTCGSTEGPGCKNEFDRDPHGLDNRIKRNPLPFRRLIQRIRALVAHMGAQISTNSRAGPTEIHSVKVHSYRIHYLIQVYLTETVNVLRPACAACM